MDIQKAKIKGEHFFFNINKGIKKDSIQFKKIQLAVSEFVKKGKDNLLNHLIQSGYISEYKKAENLIANVGKNVIARLLAGDNTYTGEVNYGAVGDGTTPFTAGSIKLNNEIYRMTPSSQSFDGAITYLDFFIAEGDTPNITIEEWATFIDGNASADSGQAFSLLITNSWVKSGSIYISSKYTII